MAEGDKPAFTPEQSEALTAMMGQQVNAILTARLNTVEKKLLEKVTGSIGESLTKQLPELLQAHLPKPADNVDDGKGGKGGKDGKEAANAEMATLRKQFEVLNAKAEAAERRNAQLREQARSNSIREQAAKFLENAGVTGDRFDAAWALLMHKGKIKPAEDLDSDEAFFVDSTLADPVALEVGLGGWLKSEQAKLYLPPANMRGSGSRPSRDQPSTNLTDAQRRGLIAQKLEAELGR